VAGSFFDTNCTSQQLVFSQSRVCTSKQDFQKFIQYRREVPSENRSQDIGDNMKSASNASYLRDLYQSWSERMTADPNMTIADLRDLFDEWHLPTLEPENVTYRSGSAAGVDVLWVLPVGADKTKVIIYTHGGGFAVGSSASHRKLVGHLAKHLGVTAVVLDYRRAPESPFPAQIEDVTAVYRSLVKQGGYAPKNIVAAGDSAGGNLAISTVLCLRAEGDELPGAVIAFSPWLDMQHVGKTLETNAGTDALVSKEILQAMSGMYLGTRGSRVDPLANPLKANFKNFPRLYITAGSDETLLDNAQDLERLAKADGVDVVLSVVDGMQHVFPFLAGRAKEADEELSRIAKWFKGA
jgi:epsilon-lactone hydrolase